MLVNSNNRDRLIALKLKAFLLLLFLGSASLLAWVGLAFTAVMPRALASNGNRPNSTPTPTSCVTNYNINQSSATAYETGTDLVAGSQCDDCAFTMTLPFAYTLYGQSFTSVTAISNGHLDFGSSGDRTWGNYCLPNTDTNSTIFAHWDDLSMDYQNVACNYYPGYPNSCGVFTSISGSVPDRIFNIEYRAFSVQSFPNSPVHFIIRLYEGQQKFDVVYLRLAPTYSESSTIGVQENTGSVLAQYQCPGSPGSLINGSMLTFIFEDPCVTATPTPTEIHPVIRGHATWEGRQPQPNPSQALPISLTLRLSSGGPNIDYPLQNTDASGYFTVSVDGLANGTYYWNAKGPQYLANSGTLILAGDPVTVVELGLMRAGDANGDNVVNISDFNILRYSFATICGYPQYDSRPDFTGDCSVNIPDFMLLKVHFNQSGASLIHVQEP
jgi:hypothetical protein